MTYLSDSVPVTYMGEGAQLSGEDAHQALGENTAVALGGHMLRSPAQGVSPGTFSHPGQAPADDHPMAQSGPQPGHGYEDEPVDQAEREAQHTAQTVAADQAPSHAAVSSGIRSALRYGGTGA